MDIREQALCAKRAAKAVGKLTTQQKNALLQAMADALRKETKTILEANAKDVDQAKQAGMATPLIDRLLLTETRIDQMAEGLEVLCRWNDPIGTIEETWQTESGLTIARKRVPLGLLCIIYEGRPNVTVDAAGLALKAGNGVLLRGSSSAIHSNQAITSILRGVLKAHQVDENAVTLIDDVRRESVDTVLSLTGIVDCAIPRGGAGLIQHVLQVAKVPVIETGVGNCHLYVDKDADLSKALQILLNGKCQRPGVCNALETLLVHQSVAEAFLPSSIEALQQKGVTIYACAQSQRYGKHLNLADEASYAKEFLDLAIAIRVVDSLDEALSHIERYSTGHSECIVSDNYTTIRRFLDEIDAACVYANASTRFSDGAEFGFGAEIGISTQKMHARGPMGLSALTSYKYIILGEGQIRD